MNKIEEKYDKLTKIIEKLESVIIAYSGGVDSTLLAKVSRTILGKDKVLTITAQGPSRPKTETEEAKELVEEMDIDYILIDTKEIFDKHYYHNPSDRCYYCKNYLDAIFEDIKKEKKKYKYIINGTNTNDMKEDRPGIKADKEHNIICPFVEAGMNKIDIRNMSKKLNLKTWDKPANSCLSTRIPVNCKITIEKLKQIEECEKIITNMGFGNLRVRHLGDTARIELSPDEFSFLVQEERLCRIIDEIKAVGFEFVSLDLDGYKSGKMLKVKS